MACENCAWRQKWEQKPKSFSGRFWKWHTKICPGWKAYLATLPQGEKQALVQHLQTHG
jgi:hypothetical protein